MTKFDTVLRAGVGFAALAAGVTAAQAQSTLPPPEVATGQGTPAEAAPAAQEPGNDIVITGSRIPQPNLTAVLQRDGWTMPPLFTWLQQHGGVADAEMHRVFNCGIGMAAIVAADEADAVTAALEQAGETVFRIGRIEAGQRGCTVTGGDETWSARAA